MNEPERIARARRKITRSEEVDACGKNYNLRETDLDTLKKILLIKLSQYSQINFLTSRM